MSKARLDTGRGLIILDAGWGDYEIPVSECQTPQQIAEWQAHLQIKEWGPGVMGDFLKLVTEVNETTTKLC